jgi:hypothetical protein
VGSSSSSSPDNQLQAAETSDETLNNKGTFGKRVQMQVGSIGIITNS